MVLKAQIMAGGRGKGVFSSGLKGGVKVTKEYVLDKIFSLLIFHSLLLAWTPLVLSQSK